MRRSCGRAEVVIRRDGGRSNFKMVQVLENWGESFVNLSGGSEPPGLDRTKTTQAPRSLPTSRKARTDRLQAGRRAGFRNWDPSVGTRLEPARRARP